MTISLEPEVLSPCQSLSEVERLLRKFPLLLDKYEYGTAGFRYPAHVLDPVMIRVGIAATLLAHPGSVGVMVTASHNTEEYNGVKLADSSGGMMSTSGEALAVDFVNASVEEALRWIDIRKHTLLDSGRVVHVGHDTRESSPALCSLLIRTIRAMGGTVVHCGVVTTPQLHHCVLHNNYTANCTTTKTISSIIPHSPHVGGYFSLLATSYQTLMETKPLPSSSSGPRALIVDCACGVGYPHLLHLSRNLHSVHLTCTNAPGSGPLNANCGSEHVQKAQALPNWYDLEEASMQDLSYCASLDGDADRIVFFTAAGNNDNAFTLLDGDKIACLCCGFLQEQLDALQQVITNTGLLLPKLGVVQTAYANGSSTAYLKRILGAENVKIAKTGVKHVHAVAHEEFDIGVYFESNGHGTILFGQGFYDFIKQTEAAVGSDQSVACLALKRLRVLPSLVNQAVGDALSDLLLVDAILQLQGLSLKDWIDMYTDLPSRQIKVKVAVRTKITTNNNETRCLQPPSVQPELDAAMRTYGGRTFVRPSGTEDVVRVYAEAPTQEQADALAQEAVEIVQRLCGGGSDSSSFPLASKI